METAAGVYSHEATHLGDKPPKTPGESAFRCARPSLERSPTSSPELSSPGSNTGSGSRELASIQCRLETKDLWDKFHDLGTEMIITKSGRWVVNHNVNHNVNQVALFHVSYTSNTFVRYNNTPALGAACAPLHYFSPFYFPLRKFNFHLVDFVEMSSESKTEGVPSLTSTAANTLQCACVN